MKTLISALLLFFFSSVSNERTKTFEGKIIFGISYLEVPEEMQGFESMLPQEMEMVIGKSKMMIKQSVMGVQQIVIVDNETKEGDVLMDMMGQKIHLHMTKEELDEGKEEAGEPVIRYFDEAKEILGYECKKAEIDQGEAETVTVWYTEEIEAPHREFDDLKGFPLEYETRNDGMLMRMRATTVDEKAPDASVFNIPEGYTTMTMEELQKMGGGE